MLFDSVHLARTHPGTILAIRCKFNHDVVRVEDCPRRRSMACMSCRPHLSMQVHATFLHSMMVTSMMIGFRTTHRCCRCRLAMMSVASDHVGPILGYRSSCDGNRSDSGAGGSGAGGGPHSRRNDRRCGPMRSTSL